MVNVIDKSLIHACFFGFIQTLFLAAMTYFISRKNYIPMVISSFLTNFFFMIAIDHVKQSNSWVGKVSYSIGCTVGCGVGVYIASHIQ